MSKRLTYSYVKSYIESFGYKLLSKEYISNKKNLEIECDKGHVYESPWNRFKKGSRCPYCAGLKVTYQSVKEAIEKAGYTLLSQDYKNALKKIKIECNKGHIYETPWSVFQAGSRCPHCFKLSRFLEYEDIKQSIQEEGYILLSKKYENNRTKLKIQCDKAHRYEVTWNDFKTGYRCPYCSYEKKAFDYKYIKDYIEDNGYKLLSEKYTNSTTKLKIQCEKYHVYLATFNRFQSGSRCPYCKGVKTNYAIVKEKIEDRGYKLLSKEYTNSTTKLKIQCNKGHIYETPWRTVQKGCKCPHCVIRGFDPQKPGFLYYIKIKHKTETYYKIGITNTDLKQRFYGISKNVVLLWSESFLFGEYAHQKEQEILIKYKGFLVKENLPFLSSGYTETFVKDVLKKDC